MRLISSIAVLLLSASIGFGQTSLASITGTIADASGAVIANAPVSVRNLENGAVFSAASSETGNYTVSQLPIGDYDLTVALPGFKTYTHTRFHLAAAQTMREDIVMEVGQTTESITVEADASLLKTESSTLSQNVTLSQLNNLPILVVGSTNSGFRDPFAAVRLVPGIRYNNGSNSAAGTASAVTSMVVNGTPANTYQTRLDGMTMNPTGPRLIGAQMQTQPSVDAIEEVAIETSNFAAEFGAAGGAMVNMVTKSGTNQYHGSGYDYGTNEALNAHKPYTGLRDKIRQSDWGFTVGGPVWIPKVYDGHNKTFFFWSFEQFNQSNILIRSASLPVQDYRNGDFSSLISVENRLICTAGGTSPAGACPANSRPVLDALDRQIQSGTIFDPNSTRPEGTRQIRDPFVGNIIPANRFDPIASKVVSLLPQPQGVNHDRGLRTGNYVGPIDSSRTSRIPSIKVDQTLGEKSRVSFYLQETNTNVTRTPTGADPFPDLITASVSSASSGTTIRLNYDYTLTPRLLLHFGAGWNDSDFGLEAPVTDFNSFTELGLTGQTLPRYFPVIATGVNGNDAIGGMSVLGTLSPTKSFERRPSGNVSATYVTGGHTFKLGAEYRLEKFPNYVLTNTQGTYPFNVNYTEQPSLQGIPTNQGFDGYEFASFLLGGMSPVTIGIATYNVSQAAPIALSNSKSQTALFLQDTWKVTRKLTLDLGVRWDYGTYAREQYGRNGSIGLLVPNPSAGGRLGGMQFEQTCNCNFADNYPYAIGPRVGLAYQIDNKTVLRGGWGLVYNATSTSSGSSTASASAGSVAAGSGAIIGRFQDGMPSTVRAVWPSFNAEVGHALNAVVGMPALLDPNAGRPARLMQWNIGLQREIGRNLVVEASYVANRGVWWTAAGLAPLNAISEERVRSYGFNDFSNQADGALLNKTISSLTAADRSNLAAHGLSLTPYAGFPTNQNVRQALRDYPQYSNSGLAGSPLGKTWYDSFQLNVTKRFSHGLQLNMNYNFSKNLDLIGSPDVFNRSLGKDISGNDRPHQLRLTMQYEIPELRRTGLPFLSNPIASYVFSGWGLGAYLNYESAPLLGRPSSTSSTPITQFLGRGPGSAQLKIDPATGEYMNPWSVDWVDYDGNHRTDPIDINCHCFDPTKNQVLNPLAWENIPNGQWGAQQNSLRFFRGMRTPQEDVNFSRNFRFGPEGRFNLNVRVEFNNIFNRTRLPNPSTAGNFATAPVRFPANSPNAGLFSSGFGTYSVLGGTNNQRTGSYVARLTF